jgi:hypothetical protein
LFAILTKHVFRPFVVAEKLLITYSSSLSYSGGENSKKSTLLCSPVLAGGECLMLKGCTSFFFEFSEVNRIFSFLLTELRAFEENTPLLLFECDKHSGVFELQFSVNGMGEANFFF